jgi:hypothetical protein
MSGNPFEDDEDPMLSFGSKPFSGGHDYDAMSALADIGPPPQRGSRTPADIASAMAMLADAFLNKGRTIGPLLGQLAARQDPEVDNYKLRMDDAMKRAQIQRTLQGSHADPALLEQRKRESDLRDRQIAYEEAKLAASMKGGSGGLTPEQQLAQSRFAYQQEQDARELEMRKSQMEQAAADRAEAMALRRAQLEDIAASRRDREGERLDRRKSDQSRQFTNDSSRYLELAGYLRQADQMAGEHPDDLPGAGWGDAAKLDNDWPLVGVGKEGLDVKNVLGNIRDLLARERTGAAFAGKEKEELYSLAAGLDSSDESKIRAALKGLSAATKRAILARRTGREEAADEVLSNMGVSNWLGASQRPAAAPAPSPSGRLPITGGGRGRFDGAPPIPSSANADDDEWEDL